MSTWCSTQPHVPIATMPGAWDRTLSISSGGKTFSATGWKIGWVTGPADLVDAVLAVKQFLTYVNGSAFQPAIATGLRLSDAFFRGIGQTLKAKRDLLGEGLRAAGFAVSTAVGLLLHRGGCRTARRDGCRRVLSRTPASGGRGGDPDDGVRARPIAGRSIRPSCGSPRANASKCWRRRHPARGRRLTRSFG